MAQVLVVEDDDAIREMLQQVIEIEGYQVTTAQNGLEGLNLLRSGLMPCLILLDLMMPVMDGWTFLERKRASGDLSSIPVLVVSAYPERAKSIQCEGLIEKPVNFDALLGALRKYCGH